MAAQDDRLPEADSRREAARRRSSALSPELIAILAVGVTLAGVMLTMMTVMTDSFARELGAVRVEVRELGAGQVDLRERMARVESKTDSFARELGAVRAGQIELRDRMVRVEAKVDVLAGAGLPERSAGAVE